MNHTTYTAPSFNAAMFNCPHCGALAQMKWVNLLENSDHSGVLYTNYHYSKCLACQRNALWVEVGRGQGSLVMPTPITAPLAHQDLPEDCQSDYEEARQISRSSPRGAAALLRLCIQKLCKALHQPGKDINADIGALVKLGLPIRVQQALDSVRVIGNEAVHPGTMSNDDHAQRVDALFKLVNMIVDQMITQPNEVAAIFSDLPASKLAGIADRDRRKN